jgi:hypothetical protein
MASNPKEWPNPPSAGDAGFAPLFAVGRSWPGAPDSGTLPRSHHESSHPAPFDCTPGLRSVPGGFAQRVHAASGSGAWVGSRVWEDGFGDWKRDRLRHTTCGVKCLRGHTTNSAFSGVSGSKDFKRQRLVAFVRFGAGMRRGPGKTLYPPENPGLAVRDRN